MRELKQQPGKDMLLIGSASTARAFIRDRLIDEYRLTVNPVILGGGTQLFPDAEPRQDLRLVSARTLGSGVVALHYLAAQV
jgi:dihydrofolate reductase